MYPQVWDKWLLVIALMLFCILFFINGDIDYYSNNTNMPFYNIYFSGFVGVFAILAISKRIEKAPILSYLGKYSIVTLCLHYVILYILSPFILSLRLSPFMSFFIAMVINLQLCYGSISIMKRFFPLFIAQKDIITF